MRLTIRHETVYTYAPPAPRLALRIKLFPGSNRHQRPIAWSVRVKEDTVEPMLTDAAGNAEGLWFSREATEHVAIIAEGEVETMDTAGVLGRVGRGRPSVYLRRTRLTALSPEIEELARCADAEEGLGGLHALAAQIPEVISYRPGATSPSTTAAEAMTLGAGVCQDQAHVFIAAARSLAIPARYVVGYLFDEQAPVSETHAWAEAHLDGLGWVGFDPTHQVSPTASYVRLCCGFDAADAAPLRGAILGASVDENISVAVAVAAGQQQ